jgi:hypothetical protein
MSEHRRMGDSVTTCPYCEREQDECWPEPNGDKELKQCDNCEKNFYAYACVDYNSERNCKANKQECNWVDDNSMNLFEKSTRWIICTNCFDSTVKGPPR